jgi:hypothetical protein
MIESETDPRVFRRLLPFLEDAYDRQDPEVQAALVGGRLAVHPRLVTDDDGSETMLFHLGILTTDSQVPIWLCEVDSRNVGVTWHDNEVTYVPDDILDDDLPEVAARWLLPDDE